MCPFTSLPEGEGPNQFSPGSITNWQPRRKSVNNACERCRRRKIRCDGNTPCATCARFSLQCVRTQKSKEMLAAEHQQALESRIHQLEAQLAAHVSAPVHGMESINQSMMEGISNLNWEPPVTPLTVNTTIPTPYSMPVDVDLGPFSAGSLPSIAITEPGMSPVPSFWSGTTGASSPDRQSTSAPHVPLNLSRDIPTPFSPPGMAQNSQYWDFMAGTGGLKPQTSTTDSRDLSRRSSFSSASLASDHVPSSPTEEHSSSAGAQPLPSRFEAETLTTEFVQYIESIEGQKPYGLSPSVFGRICETVYPSSRARSASVDMPVSVPMARFHVFLTMAIGMKHRLKDSAEVTNALLDRCYELAMQQTASSTFWQEPGGVEAAQLLSIFASFKNEVPFEPRQLQPSFTW